MLDKNFSDFRAMSLEKKLFFAVIFLAILARIFTLVVMPDAPQTDSLYHLAITRYVVENGWLPMEGIPEMGVGKFPVPLFYIVTAIPFILLPIPFNLLTVRVFPLLFSGLQLLLAYKILRELFPKKWFYGFALITMHPLLITFGSFNYTETFASACVLLTFFVYQRFARTRSSKYVAAMPFALAAMSLSKENATIIVPAFFLAFLYELWAEKKTSPGDEWLKKVLFFSITSVTLSLAWFVFAFFATGSLNPAVSSGLANLSTGRTMFTSAEALFLYPLNFNIAFWSWLPQGFSSLPLGISPGLAFVAFTLVTFPLTVLIIYLTLKGVSKRQKYSVLVLSCLVLTILVLLSRSAKFVYGRLLIPMLPLLAIPFAGFFEELKPIWRALFSILFLLTAIYAVLFSALYASYFSSDYNDHVPLYSFITSLPEGSSVAIHPNKTRQISFITGKEPVSFALFSGLEKERLKEALLEEKVTHVADTCYKKTWDEETLYELKTEGFLEKVYRDSCSTLYEVRR